MESLVERIESECDTAIDEAVLIALQEANKRIAKVQQERDAISQWIPIVSVAGFILGAGLTIWIGVGTYGK